MGRISDEDPSGLIQGIAFADSNDNGLFDDGIDSRLLGVQVKLLDLNNQLIATQTTDGSGFYSFTGLSGKFSIAFSQVNGLGFGQDVWPQSIGTTSIYTTGEDGQSQTIFRGTEDKQAQLAVVNGNYEDASDSSTGGARKFFGSPFDDSASLGGSDLVGTAGRDAIYGFDGNDHLYGLDGDDLLFGGTGNDVLSGSWGSNDIDGGAGVDTVIIDGDRRDFRISTADGETLNIGGAGVWNTLCDVEWVTFVEDGKIIDSFNVMLFLATAVPGDFATVRINGTDGDDSATFGGATLFGTAAHDEIYGLGGSDLIYAGAGSDKIFGGDGDDVIQGGPGFNTIDGGRGLDTAIFEGRQSVYDIEVLADGKTVRVSSKTTQDDLIDVEWITFTVAGEILSAVDVSALLDACNSTAPDRFATDVHVDLWFENSYDPTPPPLDVDALVGA